MIDGYIPSANLRSAWLKGTGEDIRNSSMAPSKGWKKRDFGEHATNKWDATFRVRNRSQRKVWQPIRAALAGNATLM